MSQSMNERLNLANERAAKLESELSASAEREKQLVAHFEEVRAQFEELYENLESCEWNDEAYYAISEDFVDPLKESFDQLAEGSAVDFHLKQYMAAGIRMVLDSDLVTHYYHNNFGCEVAMLPEVEDLAIKLEEHES